MKRRISTVVIFIIFLLFLVNQPVNAATPTPTPTPVDSSSEVIDIRNGIPNQERSFNQQPVVVGPTPTIYVDVPGINPNMDDFKIPTMNHISDWLMKTIPYMSAKQIKDNLVTHDDNLFVSGKVKRCVWVGGILLGEPFTKQGEVYETNLIKYLADLLSSNRLLSSHLVRYSVTPIGDTYDLNGPAYRIDTIELPCELPGKGTLQNPPTKIGLKKGSGITALIKWLESLVPVQITFTSKQQTAEAEVIYCTMAGCVKDREDADLEYVNTNPKNPPDEITRLEKSGGIVDAGFRAIFMDTKKKTVPHGQEQNFLDTNTLRTMQMENSADLIKCSLVPPAQRGKVALANEDCKGFVKEITSNNDCSNSTYFTELYVNHPPTSTSGATGDPGYTIPYRSTACTIADDKMDPIALFAGQWGSGGANAEKNIKDNWKTVQDISKKYGWNPLFVIALWIEESGAGATANAGWHLGCLYGWKQDGTAVSMPKISEGGNICDQMACLFSHPSQDPENFARFMCSYNTTAIQNGQCPSYPNWAFADNIYMVYSRLLSITGNPSGCAFTEVHR